LSTDQLTYHETAFRELREQLIRVLGAPTVNRMIERSATEISAVHSGMASLRCVDDDIKFDGVRRAFAEASDEEIRDAFAALNGVLLLIVARILGKELARRLTEGLPIVQQLRRGGAIDAP
jgi:hypothetical protein